MREGWKRNFSAQIDVIDWGASCVFLRSVVDEYLKKILNESWGYFKKKHLNINFKMLTEIIEISKHKKIHKTTMTPLDHFVTHSAESENLNLIH
jgi:hypothetical protein